jgi:hypothetical protein
VDRIEFEKFVNDTFVNFLKEHGLASGTISNGCGSKATVTRDKHGFYKIVMSHESSKKVD